MSEPRHNDLTPDTQLATHRHSIDQRDGIGFRYRGDQLCVDGVPLRTIAAACGSPTYVYSRGAIEAAYLEFASNLEGLAHRICYAVKANSNLALLQVLNRLGASFDIVSVGELQRVLRAGASAERIVFSGVGKRADEMAIALQAGIGCFNLESPQEFDTLESVARSLGLRANAGIRVNPNVDARTHPYISTGLRENKFGVQPDQAIALARRIAASDHLHLSGIGCHIGSQVTDLAPLEEAFVHVLQIAEKIEASSGRLDHLDLGGGLGIRYQDETPIAMDQYGRMIRRVLANRRDLTVRLEPGRRIVGAAGALITQVIYTKTQGTRNFAIVDAAMNDLIRPALYEAWHRVLPVNKVDTGRRAEWDLVGPVCESGDFLAHARTLTLANGQLLAIMEAGAYGFVMSSNYNSRGRAAEVLAHAGRFDVVRRRETIEDQLVLETLLPDLDVGDPNGASEPGPSEGHR